MHFAPKIIIIAAKPFKTLKMKRIAFIVLSIMCFQLAMNSQVLQTQNDLYQRKITKFTKMRNAGIGLGIGGVVLTAAGIVMISQANWHQTTDEYGNATYNSSDGAGVAGVFSLIDGIPMAASGIVLGTIGSSKVNYYRQKLNGLSFKVNYSNNIKGFTLAYKF